MRPSRRLTDSWKRPPKPALSSTSKQVAEDLISVSSDIEACLRGLPLIQLAQTTEIHDQVKDLQSSFGELGKQLEEHSVLTREQQDLATEVLAILRSRNSTEQNSARLISWLAEQFDSDTQSVTNEFEDLKKNLNEQAETSAESKKMVEAELLEQIVLCIDELETHRAIDHTEDTIDHTGIPREFQCGICLGVMKRPVILSSGHSFCKVCIEESFKKGPATCPYSRMPVRPDLVVENVALREAISRWWKQTTSSVKEVAVKTEPVLKRSYSEKAVQEMVKELGSQNHIRLLRNLNFLLEVSSSVDGPALIYKLGGVEPLANLLESSNKKITEKVTSILAQLTKASTSSDEDPDGVQLLNDIFERCLDKLISLMSRGTGMTRLRAAETLANLLLIPEQIECLLFQPGIVASLASLSSESGDALRGLAMLSRNSDHGLIGSDSLVACLVDFLHSEEDHIVEEAVVALRSGLTPQACTVLRTKNALPSLVRCAVADGVMQEAAVMILETFVKHEGFSELVDAGFTKHISGLLSSPGLSENKVLFAGVLRLSKGCLEAQQDVSLELVGLQSSIPRLMSVLPIREYTAEALALLKTIFVKDSTCKELVLDTGGLQVFQELASSSLSACRKGALALIRILLRSSSCQETFTRAGGINTLGNVTLIDESIECITEAVVCLSLLTSALESLELDKINSFMDERFPGECREAAGSIAILLLGEESSPPLSKQSLNLLMNVVQQGENVAVKRRAGKLLLMYATTRGLEGATRMVSLEVFVELVEGAGEAYRNLLLKFISGFSQSQAIFESGGIPLLLNAFSTKEYQRAAAGSIRTLVNSIPSSHEALLEAGFGETGVEFLSSESDESKSSCIADISASLVSIYLTRKQDPLFMDLIRALVKLMKNSSLDVISSAACSVFQLLPLDIECMRLLKNSDLMKPLLELLQSGPKLEALELLDIAVEDANARGELCREGGIPKLIQCLDLQNHVQVSLAFGSDVATLQELASSILLTLGKPNDSIPDYRLDEIRQSMISSGIITNLLKILGEPRHTAVMNSACLIRNLSYSGQNAAAEEVFTVLFDLLMFYMNNTSTEGYTERLKYVFLALQPFFGDRRLKMLVWSSPGVALQALSVGFGDNDEDIKHCALNLLLELLEEVNLSREVASTLVTKSVSHLRNIMQNVENINCKKLACLLMKQMIKLVSNPQQACKVMRERDCIKVLFYLKQFPGCSKEANEVLELMKKNERASKICIADAEISFFPWGRTNSATF